MSELVLIAAVGAGNRVIGKGLDLPWRLPEDLRRFKALTLGHPLIMGRRTFESLVHQFGGPLSGRRNVVVSTHREFPGADLAEVYLSIEEALAAVGNAERVFIGGGASIYAHFLPIVDRLELTLVDGAPEGDVFFPPWEHLVGTVYDLVAEDVRQGFRFNTYVRRPGV